MEKAIEEKWKRVWEEKRIFEADPDERKEKIFVTVPFPYMNGPLHVGHALTDGRVDVYARFKRMQGFNTLYPYAWHWTGQPLVAAADRLSKGDPAMVREFVELEHIPKDAISRFYDPIYMARYYTDEGRESLKRLGLSIDWRREFHTTDLEPSFNKFVLWQMNKLRDKGYITRGTHPVVWCPHDESPTGDHDRLEGEGVTWEEFVLILFPRLEDQQVKLVAATLRPETIFGVTNIWINPEARYVEAIVNGKDRWVISARSAFKLGEQLKKITIVREFLGRELIGSKVRHPLDDKKTLLVLPANFVNSDSATGVVYGVPAHAPLDYVALRDIVKDSAAKKEFALADNELQNIRPVAVITVPGMSEFPAVEITEKMKIIDQKDPRVAEATSEIYSLEFHQGVLNATAQTFADSPVSKVKPLVVERLKQLSIADTMYELSEKVVCRCTTECIVKILQDQWFLKYSDPQWKKQAHRCVDQAAIYPENARQWFHDVIDWFRDWPCARRIGLGTPLPWSPGWIVETLSDSTIYMAFYTISSTIKKYNISPEKLTDSLFNYAILNEGGLDSIVKDSGLTENVVRELQRQFQYWYPVNLRNSAKELIPNHLTFFVFCHVAFFPEKLWPTAISANGMLTRDGAKMSKSKGNLVTLREALDEFGPDIVRASVLSGSDGLEDVDWREKSNRDLEANLASVSALILSMSEKTADREQSPMTQEDLWLETKIQQRVASVIRNLDQMKTKSAFQEAFYGYWADVRYYLKRIERPSDGLLIRIAATWIRLLSPFVPFTCEELNARMGGHDLVSNAKFPEPDMSKISYEALLGELAIQQLLKDSQRITRVLQTKPSKLYIFIAKHWTYEVLIALVEARRKQVREKETLSHIFKLLPLLPKEDVARITPRLTRLLNELGENFIEYYRALPTGVDEAQVYENALRYIERELAVKITVQKDGDDSNYDPKKKAQFALPFKPALYFE